MTNIYYKVRQVLQSVTVNTKSDATRSFKIVLLAILHLFLNLGRKTLQNLLLSLKLFTSLILKYSFLLLT